ncbi:hypothetical protein FXW78_22710 [Rhodococcus opacus]|nr:hypothetical protein [Rhodococcus opacus]
MFESATVRTARPRRPGPGGGGVVAKPGAGVVGPGVAGPLAQVLAEQREARALREQVSTTQTRQMEWIESLAEDAWSWADGNGLCGQFDRCMEEHGLAGRYRDFTVEVSVSIMLPVTLTISASGTPTRRTRSTGTTWRRHCGTGSPSMRTSPSTTSPCRVQTQ